MRDDDIGKAIASVPTGRKSYPHTSFYASPDLLRRLGDAARALGMTSNELLTAAAERTLLEHAPDKPLPDAERLAEKVATSKAWLVAVTAERTRARTKVAEALAERQAYLLSDREKRGWRRGDVAGAKLFGNALVVEAVEALQRAGRPLSAAQIVVALPPSMRARFEESGHALSGASVDAILVERAKRGKFVRKADGLYSCIDERVDPRPPKMIGKGRTKARPTR